ncbi:hypothetical protein BDQ12DRAFT_450904 [Crucibulum laeve]|uniref:Uncharacterized protein n=1 Tax=Crucibulum laeve TaxID=68775 RepID=A0A5C3LM55_9AGAR|nr:hypothetical protein BDQ12DRAFT_450904 [Crucibulum laeve]
MAMNHHHHHHHHYHHTEYAIPVIRPPSPASSIGTVYRADQTSLSDSELYLPQPNFEQKWEEKNGIHKVMEEEEVANRDPLLPRPQSLREQEDAIMRNLRKKVKDLQDNDLFEQTLLRGSQASLEPQPTTNDIDSILRSMMGPGMNISGLSAGGVHQAARKVASESVTDGPWNNYGKDLIFERGNSQVPESLNTSTTTVGKRSRSGRSRRP